MQTQEEIDRLAEVQKEQQALADKAEAENTPEEDTDAEFLMTMKLRQIPRNRVEIDCLRKKDAGSCQSCDDPVKEPEYVYRVRLLRTVEIRLCRCCLDAFRNEMRNELSRTT